MNVSPRAPQRRTNTWLAMAGLVLSFCSGCYAPMFSHGVDARTLPESFRTPQRSGAPQLNFTNLTIRPHADYLLGPGDVLDVTVHGLFPDANQAPIRAQVMASGNVNLPVVGPVQIGGMNITQATDAVAKAYADGVLNDPRVNVWLVDKASISVVVLGEVGAPGVYKLPKYENDVAHAIAAAGGLAEDAGNEIEVHRRVSPHEVQRAMMFDRLQSYEHCPVVDFQDSLIQEVEPMPVPGGVAPGVQPGGGGPGVQGSPEMLSPMAAGMHQRTATRIVRIPLLGAAPQPLSPDDIVLNPGDVVTVPSRKNEIFYVVSPLSPTNGPTT